MNRNLLDKPNNDKINNTNDINKKIEKLEICRKRNKCHLSGEYLTSNIVYNVGSTERVRKNDSITIK